MQPSTIARQRTLLVLSSLKTEKMSPMKPLSIDWYCPWVRTSETSMKKVKGDKGDTGGFLIRAECCSRFVDAARYGEVSESDHMRAGEKGVLAAVKSLTNVRWKHGDVRMRMIPSHHPCRLPKLRRYSLRGKSGTGGREKQWA